MNNVLFFDKAVYKLYLDKQEVFGDISLVTYFTFLRRDDSVLHFQPECWFKNLPKRSSGTDISYILCFHFQYVAKHYCNDFLLNLQYDSNAVAFSFNFAPFSTSFRAKYKLSRD